MSRRVSAFDLDQTLLTINSSFLFGMKLPRLKKLSFPPFFYSIMYYMMYHGGALSLHELHQKAFEAVFKGRSQIAVEKEAAAFAQYVIEKYPYLPAIQKLREAQVESHQVFLLSSSPTFLVEPIAKLLGIDVFHATTYATDAQGCFTHIEHIVDGEYKASILDKFLMQNRLDKSHLDVYSDSHLDLPMLKMAGRPWAVRPDKQLKRISLDNGWSIL